MPKNNLEPFIKKGVFFSMTMKLWQNVRYTYKISWLRGAFTPENGVSA